MPVEARVEMQPSSKIFRCMPKVAAILLVAIVLAGCRQEVSQAAGPPPVTVAHPVKRTTSYFCLSALVKVRERKSNERPFD